MTKTNINPLLQNDSAIETMMTAYQESKSVSPLVHLFDIESGVDTKVAYFMKNEMGLSTYEMLNVHIDFLSTLTELLDEYAETIGVQPDNSNMLTEWFSIQTFHDEKMSEIFDNALLGILYGNYQPVDKEIKLYSTSLSH